MNTEFLIQLGAVFTVISGILVAILKWNQDKFKIKVDDDTVKRKEISALLEQLYKDTQNEIKELRINHRDEIATLKKEHSDEMNRRDMNNAEEIRKRDIIIAELISRLPKEAKEVVEAKMQEINLHIVKQ